jgi:hypothetical protein
MKEDNERLYWALHDGVLSELQDVLWYADWCWHEVSPRLREDIDKELRVYNNYTNFTIGEP